MNGVRARLPELLLWLLGLGGATVTTALIRSADWITQPNSLDARGPFITEVALATQAVAPTVVTAGLAVLLVRAGHRVLATALAAIWLCVVGVGMTAGDGVWWIVGTDSDGNPEPRAFAVLAATTLAIVVGPLVLARRAGRDVPSPIPAHRRRRDVLPLLLGLLALGVGYQARPDGVGEPWALPAIAVAVTAALAADRRRPDVVGLAHLAGMYLAWRLVVLGLARPEGLGSVTFDVVLLVVVVATAGLVRYGPGTLAAVRRVTSRGPRLWGPPTTTATPTMTLAATPTEDERGDDATIAPIAVTTPAAPLPVRALAAATAAAIAATGVVAWVAHERSDGVVARKLADARADVDTLDAALPAGWRIDPTGTACGSGLWSWCATTDAAPADAARLAADALAAAGRDLGKVTCPSTRVDPEFFPIRPGAPILLDKWSDSCLASRRDGDVVLAVVAARTLVSLSAGYPAVPQPRTAVAVGAWSNLGDDGIDDSRPWPAAQRASETAGLPALLAPTGWRGAVADGATDPDRSVQVRVTPPAPTPAEDAVKAVGAHLLAAGFRVELAGCGEHDCRVVAHRWVLPDRTGPEFVIGRAHPDGTVVLGVSLQ